MDFYPGFAIDVPRGGMGFIYGKGTFGPEPEIRYLEGIRSSLMNPYAEGPDALYCIAMDVGRMEDRADLLERNLLYGAVTYAPGKIGDEPVRSQGHIHAVSPSCQSSTCEVYEIWEGTAYIYLQENGGDDPGRCFAVCAAPGEVVIVPPGWVHATVNADVEASMSFGAWCVRDYGFDYKEVRAHNGIAYFPMVKQENNQIIWTKNPAYQGGSLELRSARSYEEMGLQRGVSIYEQYQNNRSLFQFVTRPGDYGDVWTI